MIVNQKQKDGMWEAVDLAWSNTGKERQATELLMAIVDSVTPENAEEERAKLDVLAEGKRLLEAMK